MPTARVLLMAIACLAGTTAIAQDRVDFNFDIKPILSDRCFICHGPDAENREAELRLDIREGALGDSQSGDVAKIIRPGSAEQSELYRRIASVDSDVIMPPPDSHLALSKKEVELIKRWIDQGAEWKDHWSFIPLPVNIPVPQGSSNYWVRNEIDNFTLKRMRAAGLQPTGRASRERLIRRLTFDLTGLPPTLDEIDAFVADESKQAYERVVDRLLKSPRYGERMTADWLDVARYSDTYGFQVDRDRFVWPWRDWVVRSFNDNMRYDDFVTQQIAGDLLNEPTQDQILATTFNRLHPQKVEGGSVPEEFRVEYVADRTQTFSTAFLGLTMECARCHDHKYDPIAQKEYYQLFAFFNNIDEAGLYSYFTPAVPTPTLLLSKEKTEQTAEELDKKIFKLEAGAALALNRTAEAFAAWVRKGPDVKVLGQIDYLNCDNKSGPNNTVEGKVGKALRLTGDDAVGLKVGNFKRYQPFSVSLWMKADELKERAVIFHRSRAWTDAGSRGYQLLLEDGRLSASLIHFWPGNAIRVRANEPVPVNEWTHVTMTWSGSTYASGLRLYVNGEPTPSTIVRDNLYKNITGGGGDKIAIGQRFRDLGFKNGLVDEFRVFDRELTALEARKLSLPDGADLDTNANELHDYYLATVDEEEKKRREQLIAARKQRCELLDKVTEIMVMKELPKPRRTHRLDRGAYDAPAEEVKMETPAVFPSFPPGAPRNRLGLARWLTSPSHPLTSRVAVNRIWQMLFGNGLVRTPEDFGSQGELPTHPGLLDWLSRDFIVHNWDVKRLIKKIVMSATYRQDSDITKDLLERDPENRLLARAPSYRLPAEMLRDSSLSVSGLLVEKIGGRPAKPYEVEVSFKPAKRDKGEGLYRRSLYTYWKRTGPAPMMMTLDASKRDVCRVRRERTSSPLQAFVLLNGPQFVEAARSMSVKLLEQHGEKTDAALVDLFRALTSRKPTDAERPVVMKLFETQLASFTKRPKQADAYLKLGDAKLPEKIDKVRLAAMTVVANTLMSFDESVTKR